MSPTASTRPHPSTAVDRPIDALSRSILLTLAYSDLFDYPLTADELYCYLVAPSASRRDFDRALADLPAARLARQGAFFCLPGREAIIPCRAERCQRATGRWRHAERFARRLAHVPFLRMVAVCGSQAVDNPGADGDIDLFLITAPKRLWLAQAATMILRRVTPGADFCPNYLLTESSLDVGPPNLYTAREISQAVPLWGDTTYAQFLDANRWTERFLPHRPPAGRRARLQPTPPSRVRRVLERLLSGRLGDGLERAVHQLLIVYYTLRLRGRGWTRADVVRAYRRDRQVVITGGYLGAVAARFLDRARAALADARLPDGETVDDTVARCFLGHARETPPTADPLYTELLRSRYGDAHG